MARLHADFILAEVRGCGPGPQHDYILVVDLWNRVPPPGENVASLGPYKRWG